MHIATIGGFAVALMASCGAEAPATKALVPGAGISQDAAAPSSASASAQEPLERDAADCEVFYRAEAAYVERCGGIINSSPAAVSRFRRTCGLELAAPGAESLRAARAACAKRKSNASCNETLVECEVPAGSLDDGAPCAARSQCKSKACRIDQSGCGTCVALSPPKGTCSAPSDCQTQANEVASCDFRGSSATGTCSVWKLVGKGVTCNQSTFCTPGNHCEAPTANATTGTCVANGAKGAACTDSRACQGEFACVAGVCADRPTAGQACSAVTDCAAGLACDETCQPIEYVGPGEACGLVRRCARGLCVQNATKGPDGAPIASGEATCTGPIEDGEACSPDDARAGRLCDSGAMCIGGQCTLPNYAQCK